MNEDIKNTVSHLLSGYHVGASNAVHCETLALALNVGKRKIRSCISELRREGIPVCSDQNGYYIGKTSKEISETVRRLNRLSNNISEACYCMVCMSASEEARQ